MKADVINGLVVEMREILAQMDADERCPVRYSRKVNAWIAILDLLEQEDEA